tara:strand:+ start:591 stop:1220 length:630 start_codon:yes stop_codon:yes gene_type:complete
MTSYIDNYALKSGALITVQSVISADPFAESGLHEPVEFRAFITSFSDNMTSNWNEEQVYGRQDPIGTFQSTTRKISLGFDLPAASLVEARGNLGKVNSVKQFMYPAYSSNVKNNTTTNALSLAKSPLVRLKFANLIQNGSEEGLLGWIGSFSATPVIDMGMFNENSMFFPKVYNVSLDFTPQHEYDLGLGDDGMPIDPKFISFPYDGGR